MSRRKLIREIERRASVVVSSVEPTGSGHFRLCFVGGGTIVVSASPSCPYAAKHAAADARRVLREGRV